MVEKTSWPLTRRKFVRAASLAPAAVWMAGCQRSAESDASLADAREGLRTAADRVGQGSVSLYTAGDQSGDPFWNRSMGSSPPTISSLSVTIRRPLESILTATNSTSAGPGFGAKCGWICPHWNRCPNARSRLIWNARATGEDSIRSWTGTRASGGQWTTGAVGCAEWSGPSLATLLELAEVRPEAVDVNLVGLDDSGFERVMPVTKALDPDTIIALRMNGEDLPADHGYPARVVVPGWSGSNSIKWIGEIHVATERVWNSANTTSYVLIGDQWPPEEYAPADGGPITELVVKSAPCTATAGADRSGDAPFARVRAWPRRCGVRGWNGVRMEANHGSMRRSWTRFTPWRGSAFEFEWDADRRRTHARNSGDGRPWKPATGRAPHERKGLSVERPLATPRAGGITGACSTPTLCGCAG